MYFCKEGKNGIINGDSTSKSCPIQEDLQQEYCKRIPYNFTTANTICSNFALVFKARRKTCILHPLIFSIVQINMFKSSQKGNSHLQLLHNLNEKNLKHVSKKSGMKRKNDKC